MAFDFIRKVFSFGQEPAQPTPPETVPTPQEVPVQPGPVPSTPPAPPGPSHTPAPPAPEPEPAPPETPPTPPQIPGQPPLVGAVQALSQEAPASKTSQGKVTVTNRVEQKAQPAPRAPEPAP